MLRRNVDTDFWPVKIGGWRKSALSTWKLSKDCSIYCPQTIDVGPALAYLKEHQNEFNTKLTLTHLAIRACALMARENPQINRLLRKRKLYQRKEINISVLAANPKDPQNLSNMRFYNADKITLQEIAGKAHRDNRDVKEGRDSEVGAMKKLMGYLPQTLVDFGVWALEKILYGLNIQVPFVKFPKDAFGCVMISNVGFMGVRSAFVPLVPWTRAPLMLSMGEVYERPVVKNGEITIETSMDCFWTADHRLIDGLVGARMTKSFERHMTSDFKNEAK
jgi:pyruvate/2-oxoglutarate dehydrogenase complex dihydrolipoamide acyltransferase (E2) component